MRTKDLPAEGKAIALRAYNEISEGVHAKRHDRADQLAAGSETRPNCCMTAHSQNVGAAVALDDVKPPFQGPAPITKDIGVEIAVGEANGGHWRTGCEAE